MAAKFDLQDYLEAWRDRDLDRVLEFYADDVVYREPGLGAPARGKGAYRENAEKFMNAFDGLEASDIDVNVQSGNTVAWLVRGTGVHARDLRFMDGRNVPATSKKINLDFADFMVLDGDGKIKEETLIFDRATLLQQLGASPEVVARR